MKLSKRLLAVMMVVVMVLTLVPLSMFAFAEDPVGDGTAANPIIIDDLTELKAFLEGIKTYPSYTKVASGTVTSENFSGNTYYTYDYSTSSYKVAAAFKSGTTYYTLDAISANQYRGDFCYKLSDTGVFDVVTLWCSESATNAKKAATDIKISANKTYVHPASYDPNVTYYADDQGTALEGVSVDSSNYSTYYVEAYTALTDTQIVALTSVEKKTIMAANNIAPITITPSSGTFSGVLDGNNKTVYGLKIAVTDATAASLISSNTGTIKDLTIDNYSVDVTTEADAIASIVGGLVGTNEGTISNVSLKDTTITVTGDLSVSLFTCVGGISALTTGKATITNSAFSGTINYKLNSNAFTDTSKLATKDASNIAIGGITASNSIASDKLATQFAGNTSTVTLNSDFIGGVKFVANKMYPECKDTGSDITPALATSKKTVDAKDAVLTDGDTSATDWSSNNYRAVKTTTNQYYIQHVVCGHSKSTHYDAVAPTCSATGKKEYWYCADCKTYYEGSAKPTKDSTNVTADSLVIDKDPANHKDSKGDSTLTAITKKTATCTEIGYNIPDSETYYYCTGCKNYYSDDTAATQLQASDVEISKLPHSFTNYTYNNDATTAKDGTETATCDNCTATNTRTKSGTRIPTVQIASTSKYEKDSGCIVTTLPSTKSGITVSEFKSNLSGSYTVKDENGNVVTSGVVKTGYTVEITGYPTSKMTIVVLGDVNKDGVISSLDYVRVKNIILKKFTPDAVTELAANANGDKKISSLDYVKIKNIILKSK